MSEGEGMKCLKHENEEWDRLMNQLTHELKSEVQADIYFPVLSNCDLLEKHFSKDFIKSLCPKLKTCKYIPGDVVFT